MGRIVRTKGKDFARVSVLRPPSAKPPVFEFAPKSTAWLYRCAVRNRTHTWGGRYGLHNDFLRANKDRVKVFADVGAGNVVGAPTTVECKKILGPDARVIAVDRKITGAFIGETGVEQLKHRITRGPLPFVCDAVALRNVATYLSERDFLLALDNVWRSLKPHGLLLTAGPTEPPSRPKDVTAHNERVLIKVAKTKNNPYGFVELKLMDKDGRVLY